MIAEKCHIEELKKYNISFSSMFSFKPLYLLFLDVSLRYLRYKNICLTKYNLAADYPSTANVRFIFEAIVNIITVEN